MPFALLQRPAGPNKFKLSNSKINIPGYKLNTKFYNLRSVSENVRQILHATAFQTGSLILVVLTYVKESIVGVDITLFCEIGDPSKLGCGTVENVLIAAL